MLKGDLTSTPLAPLLLELANDTATGCLAITDSIGDEALVYLKAGLVYFVSVPGSRPRLGAKLVSSGALAPEALAEALDAQRTELQGWRLGELLVHLGYVDQPVVSAFVKEQVSEAIWDLLRWPHGEWKFRKNVKAREDVGPAISVMELLEILRDRGHKWETISAVVHGPTAVPKLSTRSAPNPEATLDSDAWSLLCKIDGDRSIAELARDCGYTLFEAGHVIVSLVRAGLVDIEEDFEADDNDDEAPYGASMLSAALSGEFDPDDMGGDALERLARLVDEVSGDNTSGGEIDTAVAEAAGAAGNGQVAPAQRAGDQYSARELRDYSEESFAASIARVSNALSDVLGDVPPPEVEPVKHVVHREPTATDDPEWERRKRLRSAAAAELATAQALIESLRVDDRPTASPEYDGDVPRVLSQPGDPEPATTRNVEEHARNAAEEAARVAAEDAARVAAEQFARAAEEEADRVAAEQEAQRVAAEAAERAAEAEAERIRAERDAAAEAAWAEKHGREEAERAAAQEAARLAAEVEATAEAERIRVEREAAEAAAWVEYGERESAAEAQRLAAEAAERAAAEAAEQTRLEADRIAAAEAERARVDAVRAAAEEAARYADETAAATALLVELATESDSAPGEPAAPEPEPEPEPEPTAETEDAEPDDTREAWTASDNTDTAALLRELSSLSGDDERKPANATAPHRTPRPTNEKKPKKKIGLFGL